MNTFDVIVWKGELSDGSICYAAWCSYVLGVGAQKDTEEEALESITAMMVDTITHPWSDESSLADEQTAAKEMAELMRELESDGTPYRVHRVTLPIPELADV